MKLNIKDKIKKNDIILFICIFIFAIIVNNAFLQRHYSSDTMCLIEEGYFDYPSKYFLLDGRIISTLICYIGGVLNLPIDTYLFISNFIGIFLLSLSIIILFKFTVNYLEIKNKWIKFLTLLSIYTILINHMSIEYLLYPESCVMCAALLFSIIAAITYLDSKKRKNIKSFIFLLISTLCYQGLINIFPTLVIVLMLLKIRKNPKETFKVYIKEMFKLGIMFIIVMLISAGIIAIFNEILESSSNRLERIKQLLGIVVQIPVASFIVFLKHANKIPLYLSVIVMSITNILIIMYSKKSFLFKYILANITAYLFCMLPVAVYGYIASRILMSIGATMGISLLFITKVLNDNESNISIKDFGTIIMSMMVITYFIFNVINNYINSYEHLKAFAIDEKIGEKISQIVQEYEEYSGKEITKFSYLYDIDPQQYENGVKQLGSLTERKFAMPWCIRQSVNYYCNKKLEEVMFSSGVYYNNFFEKNYTEFSEEQIIFGDDTLYMYVY